MKKFLSICSVILILSLVMTMNVTTIVGSAINDQVATIYAETVSANNGDTVKVNIGFRNNPGITTFRFNVSYDENALELNETKSVGFTNITYGPKQSPLSLMWNDSINDNNKTNGTVCELTFKIKNGEQGKKYSIDIGYDSGDILNYDLEDVDFAVENGYIEIPGIECKHESTHTEIIKQATCLEEGQEDTICNVCSEIISSKVITKIAHSFDDGVETTEPTCADSGVKTYTCKVCGETKTEVIPPKGDDFDDGVVTIKPTCTEDGVKTYTCKNCSETKTESVPALGHDYDSGKVTKEPTCEEKGEMTFT